MQVTVTYLAMTDRSQLKPKPLPEGVTVERVLVPSPELNRSFYVSIGKEYAWNDRLPWTLDQWQEYVSDPSVETWILNIDGDKVGYFELQREASNAIDIRYFGLFESCTGRGLGGAFLTAAVDRAWELGAAIVTVNTCTLDHPAALGHYLARGFQVVKTVVRES